MVNKDSKSKLLEIVSQYYLPTLLIVAVLITLGIVSNHPDVGQARELVQEHLLRTMIGYAVLICEISAGFVILIGVFQALFAFLRHSCQKSINKQIACSQTIRLRIGYRLSLALEFAVAADILRLAISPRLGDLLILFVVILLRVLMNFFLEHDIEVIREYDVIPELHERETETDKALTNTSN